MNTQATLTAHFGYKLVDWYQSNSRDLPWRHTRDPYPIWLSEVILQQTRVVQGRPYYERFMQAFPDIHALAAASEKEVLALWQGLGYYSRARNMHATARTIVLEYGGEFPASYRELIGLSGVGDYTASAIASFAFDEQTPVVDGNVFRVLSRYYGIFEDIANPASRNVFKKAAAMAMPPGQAAAFNQAIMEFGALQCTPVSPLCPSCPVSSTCYAFRHEAQSLLPVKNKKTQVKERHIHYVVLRRNGSIAMKERTGKDIWEGLFDFLEVEAGTAPDWPAVLPEDLARFSPTLVSGPAKHLLTHRRLLISFSMLELPETVSLPAELQWYTPAEIKELPKPLPINRFLKDFL